MVGPSQPSAHLERPASSIDAEGPKARVQDGHLAYDASVVESLARTSIVSENKTTASPQETIEQKAMRDPIVQEVMKTFGAKIVNVQPK
jgi:hypothetical protein